MPRERLLALDHLLFIISVVAIVQNRFIKGSLKKKVEQNSPGE